jgi:transposase
MKGEMIAKRKAIHEQGDGWLVPSQTTSKHYFVDENFVCNCPDSEFHKTTCKHAYAVRYYLAKETHTPQGIETEKMRLTYPQAWSAYNAAQTHEIARFDGLLRELVDEVEEPEQGMGRPRLSLREQAFVSIQKVYSQLSSRRASSLFGKATESGLINHAPHFNTVSKFLNTEEATPILMRLVSLSASSLKSVETAFAVDSTGFRTSSYSMYAYTKYGATGRKEHDWLKAHACVGVKTNIITAVKITNDDGADSPQFAPLVVATSQDGFTMNEVSADKAYSSKANHQIAKQVGAQAFIPFKMDATGKSRGCLAWRKAFFYFQLHQDEFMQHYHKRSNIESAFGAIKKKFGETLRSKNFCAQVNELLCKIVAYNIVVLIHEMEELKIEPNFGA